MYREPFYPLMFDGKRFIKTLTHLLMYRCGRLVGSAGTRQFTAAARRSQAYRHHDAGVHLRAATPRPRQQPLGRARTRAAGRGEGCRRSAAQ
jgi:hypothetical protein